MPAPELSQKYEQVLGRRTKRRVVRGAIRVAGLGVVLASAQAIHVHPEVVQQVPQFLSSASQTVVNSLEIARNVATTVGQVVENFPLIGGVASVIPHALEAQTPLGNAFSEPALTTIETVVGAELVGMGRKARRMRRAQNQFRREEQVVQSAAADIAQGRIGIPLTHLKDRSLLFGDAQRTAKEIVDNPFKRFNANSIIKSLRDELLQVEETEAGLRKFLSPGAIANVGAEVVEQGGKILFHGSKTAHAVIPGIALLGLPFGHRKAHKAGSPELMKSTYLQAAAGLIPDPVLGITAAGVGMYIESHAHERMDLRQKLVVGQLADALSKAPQNPKDQRKLKEWRKLVDIAFADHEAQQELSVLPQTLENLQTEYRQLHQVQTKIAAFNQLENQRAENIQTVIDLESGNWLQQAFRRRRIARSEDAIHATATQMVYLRYDPIEGDREIQVAQALNKIYGDYKKRHQ